jgi:amino-acid N-acetyltransferase
MRDFERLFSRYKLIGTGVWAVVELSMLTLQGTLALLRSGGVKERMRQFITANYKVMLRSLVGTRDSFLNAELLSKYLLSPVAAALLVNNKRPNLVHSVLLELFLHDGVGSMVVEETLEALREAGQDDVGGIIALIRPLEEDGTLVKRDRSLIEREITNFTVIEHDGVIFGCAALYPFPNEKMAEMACLTVSPDSQEQGDGERMLQHIEQRARASGFKRLFVLTTTAAHWFIKRGFVHKSCDDLPKDRQNMYNWQRKSLVLIKNL